MAPGWSFPIFDVALREVFLQYGDTVLVLWAPSSGALPRLAQPNRPVM
jgi:hypothetical protein